MADAEITRIIDELGREHSGDPWHGTPVMQLLADVDHVLAATRPLEGAQTIWEIVLHMTAWKNEVRRRLDGAPAALPLEGDWPKPGASTPQTWADATTALDGAHAALVAAVSNLPEARLFAPTNDPRDRETGQGVTHYVLLHGIVQHDVYHSGQIALLRKALTARRSPQV